MADRLVQIHGQIVGAVTLDHHGVGIPGIPDPARREYGWPGLESQSNET